MRRWSTQDRLYKSRLLSKYEMFVRYLEPAQLVAAQICRHQNVACRSIPLLDFRCHPIWC